MKKFTSICMGVLAAALLFMGCNSSNNSTPVYTSSSVAISRFYLSQDDSIIANLDTVFFAINLDNGQIFNADSLPYGTPTNKFVPVITPMDIVSAITIKETLPNGTDSVHNYATNPGDTIDFSNPVTIEVRSLDGTNTKNYTVSVNVHKVLSDSLVWDQAALRQLPSTFSNVSRQRTARTADGVYCLTTSGSKYCIAFSPNPFNDDWTYTEAILPSGADINTFTGTDDALYILANDGIRPDMPLYRSTDGGATWTNTGRRWTNIYGPMAERLLGAQNTGSKWLAVQYPSTETSEMPADMPVRGTSLTQYITFPMSSEGQAFMVGGRTADGRLSSATWSFDGSTWANISAKGLPTAYEGMMLVPYYTFSVNTAFIATKYSVMLAFGGTNGSEMNQKVFLSYDFGMNWTQAPELMQLPSGFPIVSDGQAYVFETTLKSRSASDAWVSCELGYRIPSTVIYLAPDFSESAVKPVTSWDCPFIYMFGGRLANGHLSDTVWRAAINRLTFKPII